MRDATRSMCVMSLTLVVGLALPAWGQVTARPVPGEVSIQVRTTRGPVELITRDDPGARRVTGLTVDDRVAKYAGPAPAVEPLTLTSQVVVQVDRMDRFEAAVGGLAHEPLAGVSGFHVVTYPDVRGAVAGVSALRAAGFAEAALVVEEVMVQRGAEPGEEIDPLYVNQWHFENTTDPLFDCNADGAWALGYTGQGIVAGIVEFGGGYLNTHADLMANHNAALSNTPSFLNSHGTSVAGIVGAVGYNNEGVRGLAYEADITAIDIGSSTTTQAAAITFRNDAHHVKNNSWGPTDNGTVYHLAAAQKQALVDAAMLGRGGLGTIICWAAGNGGTRDRVDYDGWANSRYSIAVGWIGDQDTRSHYSATFGNETGSSMVLVAPSGGNVRNITTTNRGVNPYTNNFGGSSASCPVLTGTVALMLEANPLLTWRDVQHILIDTTRINDASNPGWVMNGAGRLVSYDYGFGALESHDAVEAAMTWTNVAPAVTVSSTDTVNEVIAASDVDGVTRTIAVGTDLVVEHVEVTLNISHVYRGDLVITLTSPQGTESAFTVARNDSGDDYTDFTFMTVRSWGESSLGDWTLHISDAEEQDDGVWHDWTLAVHGTVPVPACPGDVTGDLLVNFDDLNELLDHWGAMVPAGTMGDVDGSGAVNFVDLEILLEAWGSDCH